MFVAQNEWCHKCNSMHPKYLDGCPNSKIKEGKLGYIEYKLRNKEEVYVLVLVSYRNEIRVQNNLFVGTKEECIDEISALFKDLPIYTYDGVDTALALELEYKEKTHYWLQKF